MFLFRIGKNELVRRYISCLHAATAIEYTLIAAGMGLVLAGVVFGLGDTIAAFYNDMAAWFTTGES